MSTDAKVIHTAKTRATGGRERGISRSSDGQLDIRLAAPGAARFGANPEQLLAVAWSISLESAIELVARARKLTLPVDIVIDAEVDLMHAEGGHFLRARFNVNLPGIEPKVARALVDEAHQSCPYSKATRCNLEVSIKLV
jgi:osmotically inducible protein OsmC